MKPSLLDSTPKISLAEGVVAIEKALGMKPNTSLVMSDFIDGREQLGAPDKNQDEYLQRLMLSTLGEGSTGASFDISPGLEEHLREIGLLRGRVITLGLPTKRDFPESSVEFQLAAGLNTKASDSKFAGLKGKTPLNNFPSKYTRSISESLGGAVLTNPGKTVEYHSKHWLRNEPINNQEQAAWDEADQEVDYNLAPGFSFGSVQQLVNQIGKIMPQFNGKSAEISVWVKYSSFSAGDGVFKVKLNKSDLEDRKSLVHKILGRDNPEKSAEMVAKKCEYIGPDSEGKAAEEVLDEILAKVPMVMEVDINSLPDTEKVIANFNIQGVISSEGISLVDSSLQETGPNGNYMGNVMPLRDESAQYVGLAQEQFLRACQRIAKNGYRGYIGGDVILRQKRDGTFDAIVIDLNPRFNGSTPFDSHVHRLQEETGKPVHGTNTNIILPKEVNTFHEVRDLVGADLFLNFDRHNKGVIPTAMRGTPNIPDNVVKMSILAPTREELFIILATLNERGIKYGSY